MTDEAKPPKKTPSGAARRPRKSAADDAKRPRKTPARAKKPAEAAAEPEAEKAAAEVPAETAARQGDETAAAATEITPGASDEAAAAIAPPEADATAVIPPDDAATELLAPDDGATEGVAADAASTQVPAGAGVEPTQVMPPGGGTPPPFTPMPRVVTPSGGGRRPTRWIVLAVAAVAFVVVVLVWAFAMRDSGEQFAGNWAPLSGEGGGLVIELRDGDYQVSIYDADLKLTGTYPAARDGDVLIYRFSDARSGLGLLKARLTYEEDRDVLVLQLIVLDQEGSMLEFVRVDALEAAPTPSTTPTPTSTPTASPTASPSGSPSPTPSPTGTDTAQNDQRVVDGIVAIQVGVLNWASANGNTFPPVADVSQSGGVAQYVASWPTNPYVGQPMASGDQPGDYTYEQLDGGQGYKLVGHLANGATFTVP